MDINDTHSTVIVSLMQKSYRENRLDQSGRRHDDECIQFRFYKVIKSKLWEEFHKLYLDQK